MNLIYTKNKKYKKKILLKSKLFLQINQINLHKDNKQWILKKI